VRASLRNQRGQQQGLNDTRTERFKASHFAANRSTKVVVLDVDSIYDEATEEDRGYQNASNITDKASSTYLWSEDLGKSHEISHQRNWMTKLLLAAQSKIPTVKGNSQ
jgi:hypothetical protein